MEEAAADPRVRVIVFGGTGRAFSSGADLSSVDGDGTEGIDQANRLVGAIAGTPKPVVAAVNGGAAGVGCSIALACDLIWAAESAYFLLAFAGVGLMPDGGATATVAAAVGRARAARMALLAERIPARQALDWGLISAVAPDEALSAEVDEVVARLAHAARPPRTRRRRRRCGRAPCRTWTGRWRGSGPGS